MNPEEGELRPQLLDRFPLSVGVEKISAVKDRIEIVKRNAEFEENPVKFCEKYKSSQNELANRIARAREVLPKVAMPEPLLEAICRTTLELKVDGLRPDIVVSKTAFALAAFENRTNVTLNDVLVAAELTLSHRTREGGFLEPATPAEIQTTLMNKARESKYYEDKTSTPPPRDGTEEEEGEEDRPDPEGLDRERPAYPAKKGTTVNKKSFGGKVSKPKSVFSRVLGKLTFGFKGKSKKPPKDAAMSKSGIPPSGEVTREQIFEGPEPKGRVEGTHTVGAALTTSDVTAGAPMLTKIEKSVLPRSKLSFKVKRRVRGTRSSLAGKRAEAVTTLHRGRACGWRFPRGKPADVHLPATIRTAAKRQRHREKPIETALKICMEDVREKSRLYRAPMTIVFVIDLSGSMAFSVAEAKEAILKLHGDAYRGRDKVGIVALKGTGAVVVQHPIANLRVVANKLSGLRISGFTPLAAGMVKAVEVLKEAKRRDMAMIPVIAIITDGGANVPLQKSIRTGEIRAFSEADVDVRKYEDVAVGDVYAVSKMIRREGIYTVVVNTNPWLAGRETYGYAVTRQIASLTNGAYHEVGRLRGEKLARKMVEGLTEDRRKIAQDASTTLSRYK